MVQLGSVLAAIAVTAATLASAHPGQPHHARSLEELATSRMFHDSARRSLAACADSKHARELEARTTERRLAKLDALRAERRRLSAVDVIGKSHKSNLTGITPAVDPVTLFGTTPACILEPEVTQGPYYVNGELIRNDVRETQPGVDLYTELQFIDVNTCEPVEAFYIDFWHCNSTGVYGGVVARGNGDSSDATLINATFARGLAPTDEDGLVSFITKFPGHYTGRTTHIHILGSHNGSVLPNNTYVGSSAASVGQIFFDQELIAEVEQTGVYATNTQPLTTNAQDGIFAQTAATGFDPVVQYVYLGETVEEGIFSWISIGINASIYKSVGAAATWTENGGVPNAGGGGGGGPPPGNGSFPGPRPPFPSPAPTRVPTPAPTSEQQQQTSA